VRWRRVDLRDERKRRFGVELHERSVGRILAVARLSLLIPGEAAQQNEMMSPAGME
jgi:hypothetical protein